MGSFPVFVDNIVSEQTGQNGETLDGTIAAHQLVRLTVQFFALHLFPRRQLEEGQQVIELLAEQGLVKGENGLRIIMMCELPSNALLADKFLDIFDGFSIGSNDLTQLTLGLDRDSGLIAHLFDERNEAVKVLLSMAIQAAKKRGKYVGICGQGPSDHEDFAAWLVEEGIDSVSLNPDTVVETWLYLAEQHGDKA